MEIGSVKKVEPNDEFMYQCFRCGDCCRNVRQAIALSSWDFFHIAKYKNQQVEEILESMSEMVFVDESLRIPILMMKVKDYRDTCICLTKDGCSIQNAKPLPCRLYPLNIGPDDKGDLDYFIVSEKRHHYTGIKRRVGDWFEENLSPDDRRFMVGWYEYASELGRAMKRLVQSKNKKLHEKALVRIMWFMYICYDIHEEFWPQYERNKKLLMRELNAMADGD